MSDAFGQDYVLVALMSTGFFMTVCLVVFCLVNLDGRLVRVLLVGEDPPVAAPDRSVVCEAIGKDRDLTRRETDVLYYFSLGQSAQQTAMALSISTNTVNTHAMGLYRKLDVHTKQEVIDLVDRAAFAAGDTG